MDHPISTTYLDQQVARVAAALPGAGAYDAAPVEMACAGFKSMTLFISYTRAAAGGAVSMRVEGSPNSTGTVWHRASLYDPGALAAGADVNSNIQRENMIYTSTAAGAETFVYGPVEFDGTVERVRIPCAESGAVANPGAVSILARFA